MEAVEAQGSPTFAQFSERWLEQYGGPPYRSRYIQQNRAAYLRRYVAPHLGQMRLSEIAPAAISAVQRDLLERGVALATVRTAIGIFAEVWKGARRAGLVLGRPHAHLAWPKAAWKRPTVFTVDERERILKGFATHRPEYLPLVAVVLLAGTRPSEAAGLRWRDLEPHTRRLEISRAIASGELTHCKTQKSQRTLIVSQRLVALLVKLRPAAAKAHTLMTPSPDAKPIDTTRFSDTHFKPMLERLGIGYRPLYAGRHSYITYALMAGAPAATVAEFCGTSIREIERSYLSWIGAIVDPMERRSRRLDRPRIVVSDPTEGAADSPSSVGQASGWGAIALDPWEDTANG